MNCFQAKQAHSRLVKLRHIAALAALSFITPSLSNAGIPVEVRSALAIDSTGRPGRNAVFSDALEARFVLGNWTAPKEGEALRMPDGTSKVWKQVDADKEGFFSGPANRGGTLWIQQHQETNAIALLEAQGHALAYVNGEPRVGDPYGYGYVRLPIQLKTGENAIVLTGLRGKARVGLTPPPAPVSLQPSDLTLPDFVAGHPTDAWGAVVVINATTNTLRKWSIHASTGTEPLTTTVPDILPLSVRKVPFRLPPAPTAAAGSIPLRLELLPASRANTPRPPVLEVSCRIRTPDQSRRVTFVSGIDGSVQYYALQPATDLATRPEPPGLVLSLHGASVEAMGQADAYAPKSGLHIVCPTNRRPYGFDWEEWGRMDALEVLDLAQRTLRTDPTRVYLTGHSMGGHGTWNLGVAFPSRFAVLAPSAGWISFASYVGERGASPSTNAMEQMFRRAALSSDTLSMATNYLSQSISILHGDADDNVRVSQARTMRSHLATFHPDVGYFEQPGAGHWWDGPLGGGADCVDWPPFFDLFGQRRLPDPSDKSAPRTLRFVTVNPGVSSKHHWVQIEAQTAPLQPSEIQATKLPEQRRLTASTRNIERVRFDLSAMELAEPFTIDVDGESLPVAPRPGNNPASIAIERANNHWRIASGANSTARKTPERYGPFKEAFQHRMVFVYGTHGTSDENAWALAKARYDAEVFWYRGNGSIDIVSDKDFHPQRYPDRGVILYGHGDSNAAWKLLLKDSPIQVSRGKARLGDRVVEGDDLACLFLRPRPDSATACVAVVCGTGALGERLTIRMPYFTSGTGFPDWMLADKRLYTEGYGGIVGAGFFDNNWQLHSQHTLWQR